MTSRADRIAEDKLLRKEAEPYLAPIADAIIAQDAEINLKGIRDVVTREYAKARGPFVKRREAIAESVQKILKDEYGFILEMAAIAQLIYFMLRNIQLLREWIKKRREERE